MKFIPDDDQGPTIDVPFFGETRAEDGWQGHATTRSYDALKSDVSKALARLNGVLHSIKRGHYVIDGLKRSGAEIHYSMEGPDGRMVYGRIDIAALPVPEPYGGNIHHSNYERSLRKRHDDSLRMALYNVAEILKAQWCLKQLNPSYVPLIPWMLGKDERTLSESYLEAGFSKALMPPDKGDFVEGEFREED